VGCWQTSDGPLGLRASSYEAKLHEIGGAGSGRRQIDTKTNPVVVRHIQGQTDRFQRLGARQVVVNLAGDVTLEHSHDLELGAAFFGATLHVGPSRRVADHADHDDPP
jgi:hypothetical protein